MLTSKEKGALRDPRQMVQLRGEQRQLNEWCRMPGLTITPFMEQKRQQFRNLNENLPPLETSSRLPELDKLWQTLRPKRSELTEDNQARAHILDAYVQSKRTGDLCYMLEKDMELETWHLYEVNYWAHELLFVCSMVVGHIVQDEQFLVEGWEKRGPALAEIAVAVSAFDSVARILESLSCRLDRSTREEGEANWEQAQRGLVLLESSRAATARMLRHAQVLLWLIKTTGLNYHGTAAQERRFNNRLRRRENAAQRARWSVGSRTPYEANQTNAHLLVQSLVQSMFDNAHIHDDASFETLHLSSLLNFLLVAEEEITLPTTLCLIAYAVLDMATMEVEHFETPEGHAETDRALKLAHNFAEYMNLEHRAVECLTALWLLDVGAQLSRAVRVLMLPTSMQLSESLVMPVVEALADNHVRGSEAFHYIAASRPRCRNVEDAKLIIRVFLQNGLWQHALEEQRRICLNDEEFPAWKLDAVKPDTKTMRRILLTMIFEWFFTANNDAGLLEKFVSLPLMEYEEDALMQYVVLETGKDQSNCIWMTLLVHYFLGRGRPEAAGCVHYAHQTILQGLNGGVGFSLLEREDMQEREILVSESLKTLPEHAHDATMRMVENASREGWRYFQKALM